VSGHSRVAILISGSGSNMVRLARSMSGDHPARAVLVLSSEPSAQGLDRARELGLPTAAVDHRGRDRPAFEAELHSALDAARPDLLALAGFMRILTPAFVERWRGRMINVHPSLLPRHRGLDTHARALAAGDREHGCTVHEVTPELDSGPILGQARVPILPGDTERSLAARVLEREHRLYPLVLRRVCEGDRSRVDL
jgi:phosphoribosylglycinamide formyltransferase-1